MGFGKLQGLLYFVCPLFRVATNDKTFFLKSGVLCFLTVISLGNLFYWNCMCLSFSVLIVVFIQWAFIFHTYEIRFFILWSLNTIWGKKIPFNACYDIYPLGISVKREHLYSICEDVICFT